MVGLILMLVVRDLLFPHGHRHTIYQIKAEYQGYLQISITFSFSYDFTMKKVREVKN